MSDIIRKWKILYSDFSGTQAEAIKLLSREVGELLNRDAGVYKVHVLPCVKDEKDITENVIAIGRYEDSAFIRKHIKREDIPQNGYLVKVFDNPEKPEYKIAIITGDTDVEVYYGAVDFIDDYFASSVIIKGHLVYSQQIFYDKLPDYCNASSPSIKTRSIFTWGHPINNYREYIQNMARLKLNQLVLWNDFVPVNAHEVVEYAHKFGIEVLWGFAWGWQRSCDEMDISSIDIYALKEKIVKNYEDNYANTSGDGIYFQSFTELRDEEKGGTVVAQLVVDLVNMTASEILAKHPNLHIQFGLHATSVKNKLNFIEKVDKRVEIVWEDCGDFPFAYRPDCGDDYNETCAFAKQMTALRDGVGVGMYYKGQLVNEWVDWEFGGFTHQAGPYILGDETKETVENDAKVVEQFWKPYQRYWLENGKKAYDMTNLILNRTNGNVNIGIAGQMSGKIWFSNAFCAQLLWNCTDSYENILNKVLRRTNISLS